MPRFTSLVFATLLTLLTARAEEIRIGAILPLTSHGKAWGQYAQRGIDLAVDELNQSGSAGHTIKVVYQDSRSEAKGALSAYRTLVDKEKVKVVIGDCWAFLTNPLIPLAERDKVILFSPTVMDRSVTEKSDYFFTLGHKFSNLDKAAETFFARHPNVKAVGAVIFEDVWNNAFLKVVEGAASRHGAAVVKTFKVTAFDPDLRTEISKFKAMKVDAIFTSWQPDIALRRMKEQHFEVPYLTSSDMVDAFTFRKPDPALYEGAYFINWPTAGEFVEKFRARFGTDPLMEAHNSYEAIRSIGKALAKGGQLVESLRTIQYEGVGGRIDFTQAPFVNQAEGKLFKVTDGAFVQVE